MLTTFDADEYVYEALRGGASGFLLKDIRSGQLVETVKTHVNRLLAKLGLRDRVPAVVLAYETSLITPCARPGKPA